MDINEHWIVRLPIRLGLLLAVLMITPGIVLWKFPIDPTTQHQHNQQSRPEHQKPPSEGQANRPLANPDATQSAPDGKSHQAKEEAYWNEQLRLASEQNLIAIFSAAIGVIGIVFVLETLKQTRKQAEAAMEATRIARDSALANDRPWVGIDSVEFTVEVYAGHIHVDACVTVFNHGPSPAHRLRLNIEMHLLSTFSEPASFMDRFIERLRTQPQEGFEMTVFPQRTGKVEATDTISPATIKETERIERCRRRRIPNDDDEQKYLARPERLEYHSVACLVVATYRQYDKADAKVTGGVFWISRGQVPGDEYPGFNVLADANYEGENISVRSLPGSSVHT